MAMARARKHMILGIFLLFFLMIAPAPAFCRFASRKNSASALASKSIAGNHDKAINGNSGALDYGHSMIVDVELSKNNTGVHKPFDIRKENPSLALFDREGDQKKRNLRAEE
eukprot:c11256_g1_i1 orf=1-333(-)